MEIETSCTFVSVSVRVQVLIACHARIYLSACLSCHDPKLAGSPHTTEPSWGNIRLEEYLCVVEK